MSTKEAIKLLKEIKPILEWEYTLDYQLALDKGIEALEREINGQGTGEE